MVLLVVAVAVVIGVVVVAAAVDDAVCFFMCFLLWLSLCLLLSLLLLPVFAIGIIVRIVLLCFIVFKGLFILLVGAVIVILARHL